VNLITCKSWNSQDAIILEFDCTCASDHVLSLEYIFGSDEYNGNVGDERVDAFNSSHSVISHVTTSIEPPTLSSTTVF
jgi:hypothetical protein